MRCACCHWGSVDGAQKPVRGLQPSRRDGIDLDSVEACLWSCQAALYEVLVTVGQTLRRSAIWIAFYRGLLPGTVGRSNRVPVA